MNSGIRNNFRGTLLYNAIIDVVEYRNELNEIKNNQVISSVNQSTSQCQIKYVTHLFTADSVVGREVYFSVYSFL